MPLFLRQRERLDRNTRGHRSRTRAIALVNVGTELNNAVRRRPGGNVDPIDIDRLRQLHVLLLAGADDFIDLIAAPARIVLEQPGDIVTHVLHAHAARRDEAEVVAEYALFRRVMHVDAIRVRNVDANEAQRIEFTAGLLAIAEMRRLIRVPIDRGRRNILPILVEDVDLFLGKIVRIGLHLRYQILLDERRRHVPVGVEIDLRRLGLHDWRLTVHPADAGAVVRIDDPVLDRLDGSPRQVDDHIPLAKVAGIGAQADDIRLELLETGGRRHVERGERILVDHAAPIEAIARLESLDPSLDERIVNLSRTCDRIEVAGGDQPLAQGLDRATP